MLAVAQLAIRNHRGIADESTVKTLLAYLILSTVGVAATPNADRIIAAYTRAQQAGDVDALMALVELSPETPRAMSDQTRAGFKIEISLPLKRAEVLPLDDEDRKTLAMVAKVYDPTLVPVAKFLAIFDEKPVVGTGTTNSITHFLGIKNGEYRFIAPMEKKPHS